MTTKFKYLIYATIVSPIIAGVISNIYESIPGMVAYIITFLVIAAIDITIFEGNIVKLALESEEERRERVKRNELHKAGNQAQRNLDRMKQKREKIANDRKRQEVLNSNDPVAIATQFAKDHPFIMGAATGILLNKMKNK